MNLGCVIMAAGQGRRFGANKLLARLEKKPVLSHVLDSLPKDKFQRIIAVVSSDHVADLCRAHGVEVLQYSGGPQSETLRLGLDAVGDVDGCMFILGDQPLCKGASIERILAAFDGTGVVRLAYQNNGGSPVLFPKTLFSSLRQITGDQGGMAAVRGTQIPITLVEAEEEWELWDVDTPQALARLETLQRRQGEVPLEKGDQTPWM